MIFKGDNGIRLVFNIVNAENEPQDLKTAHIIFTMAGNNVRFDKLCEISEDIKGQCSVVLTSAETQIPGKYKYQLTVNTRSLTAATTKGTFIIEDKV